MTEFKWFDSPDTFKRLVGSEEEHKFDLANLKLNFEKLSAVAKQVVVESDDTCCYLNLGKSKIEVTDINELSSTVHALLRFKSCSNPYSYLASAVQNKDLSNWEIRNYFDIFENCLKIPLHYVSVSAKIPLACLYRMKAGSAPWDYIFILDKVSRTFSALLAKLEKLPCYIVKSKHTLSVLHDGNELIRIPSHMPLSAVRTIFALDSVCFGCAVDEH